jgi:hypothetical protein
MVPHSLYAGPCWVSPFIIISHIGTSGTGPTLRVTCTTTPCIDSIEVRHGQVVGCITDRQKFRVAEVHFLMPRITYFELRNEDRIDKSCKRQMASHAHTHTKTMAVDML